MSFRQMSFRARAYLFFAGGRSLLIAFILYLIGPTRGERIYDYMIDPVPWQLWIVIWAAIGTLLVTGAVLRSTVLAQWGLIVIATATAVWATGITLGAIGNPELLGVSMALWWALVLKDLIQVRQPLSSPFEDLVAHYGNE